MNWLKKSMFVLKISNKTEWEFNSFFIQSSSTYSRMEKRRTWIRLSNTYLRRDLWNKGILQKAVLCVLESMHLCTQDQHLCNIWNRTRPISPAWKWQLGAWPIQPARISLSERLKPRTPLGERLFPRHSNRLPTL